MKTLFLSLILLLSSLAAFSAEVPSIPTRFVCARRMGLEATAGAEQVSAQSIVERMNEALLRDLIGNRIAGLLFDFAMRTQPLHPELRGPDLSQRATAIFHGYALACVGLAGAAIADLEFDDKVKVYREFAAATLDLNALADHQSAPWYSDATVFRASEVSAGDLFPSDEEKLAEWIELAVQWHLSRN
ncbi:MAG: hypothetical protein H6617_02560 [Bdellovibrionaceae bacterium]|nr:hypothetical protein [Bdellovibrionales bacterium]MCB9253545.1 hypothetical protein [Pseudobdellovibrionaceae bacterium]